MSNKSTNHMKETKTRSPVHVVYLVKLVDNRGQEYLKIGMSSNFENRFKSIKNYTVVTIRTIRCASRRQAVFVEGSLLDTSYKYRCRAYYYFSGYTETRNFRFIKEINKMFDEMELGMKNYKKKIK